MAKRSRWTPIALSVLIAGCVQGAPPELRAENSPAVATPGVSGLAPTPIGTPGQELPLDPDRSVQFDTTELTYASIDVAPDGERFVFDNLGDIYLASLEGGTARALTRGMAFDSQPVLNPAGTRIAFLSDRSGAENIWTMGTDGSDLRQVTFHDDDPIWVSPEWTLDGSGILVSRFRPDRNEYELWRVAAQGDPLGRVVVSGAGQGPAQVLGVAPQPGNGFIAATSDAQLDFTQVETFHLSRFGPDGSVTPLSPKAAGSHFRPRVSPDGSRVAFARRGSDDRTWLSVLEQASGKVRDVARIDADTMQASMWMDAVPRFDFTADGDALVVNRNGRIERIAIDGGQASPIPLTIPIRQSLGPLVRHPYRLAEGDIDVRIAASPTATGTGGYLFSSLGRLYRQQGEYHAELIPTPEAAFHPAQSHSGSGLLYVGWTNRDGGSVWLKDDQSVPPRRIAKDHFYTHPVFSPDGRSLYVVRSGAQQRRETAMEYRQFRDAELVQLDRNGELLRVVASGQMGGVPHFSADGQALYLSRPEGVGRIDLNTLREQRVVRIKGPSWYFVEGSSDADDVRIHPDGKLALAQIGQQVWLVELETAGTDVELAVDPSAYRLSATGADFMGFGPDGQTAWWSVGDRLNEVDLDDAADALSRPRMRNAFAVDMPKRIRSSHLATTIPRAEPPDSFVLRGASVTTMGPAGRIEGADILVVDRRIAAVGKRGTVPIAASTPIVDVTGKHVIPGLIDMHYHVADIRRDVLDFEPWGPRAALSYGVTTLFDPSTLSIDMMDYEDAIDAGLVVGSRIRSTGPAIPAYNDFRSREEVGRTLDRYSRVYRLRNIKLYRSGNRRVRQWIAEEAERRELTVTSEGTLSRKLGLTQIADGLSGLEHVLPPRRLYDDTLRFFAESGTSYAQTLQISNASTPAERYYRADIDGPAGERLRRFAPAWFLETKGDHEAPAPGAIDFSDQVRSAQRFVELGGLLGIGSHGDVPGIGTHWEMRAHVDGGLSPLETLRAATMGSATAIGLQSELGSVEAGKIADLLILDEDPVEDIRHAMSPALVIKDGHIHRGDDLLRLEPANVSKTRAN